MTVIHVEKDAAARTLRITSEYDAPVERVWQLWSDPRLLERWWGPPTYPATFKELDLTPGGRADYYMTGPEGDRSHGWWKVVTVQPPHHLEIEDGFADGDGNPNPQMPVMSMRVDITAAEKGARMSITTSFASAADMEKILSMGMEEGMSLAIGQIDGILAELASTR
jgi:uncharacterized protein YndB with AHSA1/START domain